MWYAIYLTIIDYMIASYDPCSASATGGMGLSHDFLAEKVSQLEYPTTLSPSW